jgi:serine/threonine-protein kinase
VLTGDLISGRYRLLKQLGEGGMGEVWRARNERTGREFALKILLPTLLDNAEVLARFVREARLTSGLRHPGIVDVFDAGLTPDGRPYIVMEFLSGESLEDRLARERPLPQAMVASMLAQVARALEAAHHAGIVHRDLSTPNVFLTFNGSDPQAKILDFGVMKTMGPAWDGRVRTGDGTVLGSPAYMSPEQACGAENVDHRTDIWSLGVLLYECLSGRPPFSGRNYNALLLAIIAAPHRPVSETTPGLDAELATLVESCLIKDRNFRTQSAREVAERLERIAERLRRGQPLAAPATASERADALGLPRQVRPLGVRAVDALYRGTRRGGAFAAGGIALGAAIGIAIGVSFATETKVVPEAQAEPARPRAATSAAPESRAEPAEDSKAKRRQPPKRRLRPKNPGFASGVSGPRSTHPESPSSPVDPSARTAALSGEEAEPPSATLSEAAPRPAEDDKLIAELGPGRSTP